MKTEIHPEYHEAKVSCTCGASFTTGSTAKELRLDICSQCHPFYSGKQRLVDTAGRVQRFQDKYGDSYKRRGGKGGSEDSGAESSGSDA